MKQMFTAIFKFLKNKGIKFRESYRIGGRATEVTEEEKSQPSSSWSVFRSGTQPACKSILGTVVLGGARRWMIEAAVFM